MADTSRIAEFLKAEEEVTSLANELKRLRTEVESYETANRALDDSVAELRPLAHRFDTAASTLAEVAKRLREIGTPQILESQDGLHAKLETALAATEGVNQAFNDARSDIASQADKLRSLQVDHYQQLASTLEQHLQQLSSALSEAEKRSSSLSDTIQRQLVLQSLILILLLVLILIVVS
jgi:chromosome segregation ATPase